MAEPDVFEVLDAIEAWIEPDSAVIKDAAHWRPAAYQPDRFYLYPDNEEHTGYESGAGVRQDFNLILDFTVSSGAEQRSGKRDPAITTLLRNRVRAYADRVRSNQRTATHDQLRVAGIDWQVLNGITYRGVRLRLTGFRLWP